MAAAKRRRRRLKVKTATKNKQRCIFLFFSYWRLLFFAALLFSLPANIFPFVLLPFVCFEFWPAINISFSVIPPPIVLFQVLVSRSAFYLYFSLSIFNSDKIPGIQRMWAVIIMLCFYIFTFIFPIEGGGRHNV